MQARRGASRLNQLESGAVRLPSQDANPAAPRRVFCSDWPPLGHVMASGFDTEARDVDLAGAAGETELAVDAEVHDRLELVARQHAAIQLTRDNTPKEIGLGTGVGPLIPRGHRHGAVVIAGPAAVALFNLQPQLFCVEGARRLHPFVLRAVAKLRREGFRILGDNLARVHNATRVEEVLDLH